jgi:hypothetical protein
MFICIYLRSILKFILFYSKDQSTVAKFLVKFDSESEAWRCVRTFHNTDFLLKHRQENYKLQLNVAY